MSEREQHHHQQSSDFPTAGYEAAEEERQSLKDEEERNASVAGREREEEEEQQSPEPAIQQKRGERRGGKRPRTSTVIGTAASAWQITLFDLDKQMNRQRMLMERMADDVKHLRKQFNQVQRDLAKFEKRMQKMKTTTSSSAKRGSA
jgi:uncharacterized coiled-coil protein SlyX